MTESGTSRAARLRPLSVSLGTRLTRWLLSRNYLAGRHVMVLEYPKSGGSWLARLISTALDWPFLDDTPAIPGNNCVLRGHQLPRPGQSGVVYLVRDPRDVYLSMFGQRVTHWDSNKWYRKAWLKQGLPVPTADNRRDLLPDFLRFEAAFVGRRGSASPRTWGGHVAAWLDLDPKPGVLARYEDLRADTASELQRIYRELFDADYPAELARAVADSQRLDLRRGLTHPGLGRSAVGKGSIGQWQASFSREAGRILHEQSGEQMLALGYEDSADWWEGLDD